MPHEETVAAELKAAGASLVLAMAATERGDWAAAQQGVIDAQERSALAMREIQAKLAEPPTKLKTSKSSDSRVMPLQRKLGSSRSGIWGIEFVMMTGDGAPVP